MRAGRNTLIIALLVLIAGFVKSAQPPVHDLPPAQSWRSSLHVSRQPQHFISLLAQGQPSDHTRHGEKRHGKSLLSEAIVADFPLVLHPDFTYCQHHYSPFLPGGCIRQFIGNFPLRGPPSLG
ncbi:hypothetical protein Q4E93_25725 [Flavitalea sp. BT771]|uniref:hypothetical protein n=1 Tax=Flavitalea sp. BT771 TaxID=3063329 RepID=UPI0026E1245E|nr:hypothetical protein [Flavitalea sp. BT771]MDO6434034.1 hypothetical protein [Flavitalea sp. BT771]MDV6222934.1 hypothetical protein [Flavitalea sp. BT771]